jgi:hypothetical protein
VLGEQGHGQRHGMLHESPSKCWRVFDDTSVRMGLSP